jgi:hypothetical protein
MKGRVKQLFSWQRLSVLITSLFVFGLVFLPQPQKTHAVGNPPNVNLSIKGETVGSNKNNIVTVPPNTDVILTWKIENYTSPLVCYTGYWNQDITENNPTGLYNAGNISTKFGHTATFSIGCGNQGTDYQWASITVNESTSGSGGGTTNCQWLTLTGMVTSSADNAPIQGATVTFGTSKTTTTGANGGYVFSNLPCYNTTVTLVASAANYDKNTQKITLNGTGGTVNLDFSLMPSNGAMISGTVFDSTHSGITGATVTGKYNNVTKTVTTVAGGTYRLFITAPVGSTVNLTASASGFNNGTATATTPSSKIVVQDITLTSTGPPTVSGTVFVVPGDIPLVDSTVTLTQGTITDTVTPGQDGKYTLGANKTFTPGLATITLTPNQKIFPDILPKSENITLVKGKNTKNLTVFLSINHDFITVKIVDNNDKLTDISAMVWIKNDSEISSRGTRSNNGMVAFPLSDFKAGNYSVNAKTDDKVLLTDTQTLKCTKDSECPLEIILHYNSIIGKGDIVVNIGNIDLIKLSEISVILQNSQHNTIAQTLTDKSGVAKFNNQPYGIYYLYISSQKGYKNDTRNVTLVKQKDVTYLYLRKLNEKPIGDGTCIDYHSVQNTNYWVCGGAEKKIDIGIVLKEIQTKLANLKSVTNLPNTPTMIIITNSPKWDARYNPANDSITFSSETITRSKSKNTFVTVLTHEYGHAVDSIIGGEYYWSDINKEFSTTRNFGSHYKNYYWYPLYSYMYVPPIGVYLGDYAKTNNVETFAEAFAIESLYASDFPYQELTFDQDTLNSVTPILLKTGQLVKQAAGMP